jgi:hypothetical protein
MNLSDRTRDFALRIIRLCSALPSNRASDVIARQLLKSGTSPGAHFREALRARGNAVLAGNRRSVKSDDIEKTAVDQDGNERPHRNLRLANQKMEKQVSREPLPPSALCLLP